VGLADRQWPKAIENRSWRCHYRGPILIHAGKKIDMDAFDAVTGNIHPVSSDPTHFDAVPAPFQTGGIVGEAEIVDCLTASDDPWFVGPYGIVLRNARPLRFRPCKGMLGFFEPDFTSPVVPPAKPQLRLDVRLAGNCGGYDG
jgi:hypothetical protein